MHDMCKASVFAHALTLLYFVVHHAKPHMTLQRGRLSMVCVCAECESVRMCGLQLQLL